MGCPVAGKGVAVVHLISLVGISEPRWPSAFIKSSNLSQLRINTMKILNTGTYTAEKM
jgi:hypothetical protein